MPTLLGGLSRAQRNQLFDQLNYLNLREFRAFCRRHAIPYRIVVETADGRTKRTTDTDRKPVVLHRIRHYLTTGAILAASRVPASIVRAGRPPRRLTSTDRLFYRWYNKNHRSVIRLLESLTNGRFTDGAVARILIAEFWTRGDAPTFAEFAQAWTAAKRGAPELLAPEYAYLTDRQKHRAGADWKAVRQRNAAAALTMLDDILL